MIKTNFEYDVIVYDGNAAGVGAAITAARKGLNVALIGTSKYFGGMISNGVSKTDIGIAPLKDKIGFPYKDWGDKTKLSNGLFDEIRLNIESYYNSQNIDSQSGFIYEPKVAQAVIMEMINTEDKIDFLNECELIGVGSMSNKIQSISISSKEGQNIIVKLRNNGFMIDCSDCGDVANVAGCEYWIGRESRQETGEIFAGKIFWDEYAAGNENYFGFVVDDNNLWSGDSKIQAYAYLMCIKDYGEKAPNLMTTPPNGYDKNNYEIGVPIEETWTFVSGKLPNNKYEVNVHPKGSDLQEINYTYATGDRESINQAYKDHALGYIYYIQNELGYQNLGLADDEYIENSNFPTRLYVRESRRIKGFYQFNMSDATPFEFIVSQDGKLSGTYKLYSDEETKRPPTHDDSIGIVSYAMDSHAVTKYMDYRQNDPTIRTKGEGEFYGSALTGPGNIPLRILVPKTGPSNLLVGTAISATHVGYGTLRMEPNRVNMGQACASLANISINNDFTRNDIIVNSNIKPEVLRSVQLDLINEFNTKIFYYSDVDTDYYANESIQMMSVWSIFSGFDNYEFKPSQLTNRAEFVKIISVIMDKFTDKLPSPVTRPYEDFSDVNESSWYYKYVRQAFENSLIDGFPDGTFKPEKNINLAETSKIVCILFGFSPLNNEPLPFSDIDAGDWFYDYIKALYDRGIIHGQIIDGKNKILPSSVINRAEACRINYESIMQII